MPKERKTCTRCSMRRQRCDRNEPCRRCISAGVASDCTRTWVGGYNPRIHRDYHRTRLRGAGGAISMIMPTESPLIMENPTLDTHTRLLKLLGTLQQTLPPKRSIVQLVDFHGHSLQWYHGSMSSRSFRQELCSAPQSVDTIYLRGLDLQWCALLFAIMAASLTIASEGIVTAWGFSMQRRRDLGRVWYQVAARSLDMAACIQQPGICTVQAIQVMFMSAKSLGQIEKQTQLFGVAEKTALGLGYEQVPYEATLDMLAPTQSLAESCTQHAVTNRTVWTQLCLQEWLATRAMDTLTTNRLLRTNEGVSDYVLPGSTLSIQVNPQLSTIFDTDFCIFLNRVAQVAAGHFERSCNDLPDYFAVLDLDRQLRVLCKDPIYLAQKPARIVLSHLLLLLHKRWFLRSLQDEQFAYSRWASVAASTQIIRDIDSSRESKNEPSLWNFMASHLFSIWPPFSATNKA